MKTLIALLFFLPFTASARIAQDKINHAGAGYALATTCNITLYQLETTYEREDRPWERAWICTLFSFSTGALYEFFQTLGNRHIRADPNDILATGLGGVGAAIFTIVIDF